MSPKGRGEVETVICFSSVDPVSCLSSKDCFVVVALASWRQWLFHCVTGSHRVFLSFSGNEIMSVHWVSCR